MLRIWFSFSISKAEQISWLRSTEKISVSAANHFPPLPLEGIKFISNWSLPTDPKTKFFPKFSLITWWFERTPLFPKVSQLQSILLAEMQTNLRAKLEA